METLENALVNSQKENQKLKEQINCKNLNNERKEVTVKCDECDLFFQEIETLKSHMQTEHFNFKFECRVCQKGFTQKTNLYHHIKSHDGVPEGESQMESPTQTNAALTSSVCKKCNKDFPNEQKLSHHMNMEHLDNPPYICQHCEETFETSEDKQEHVSNIHQFNCMECDHQATTNKYLIRHIQLAHQVETINEKMKFQCNSCAQRFASYFSMMNHRRDTHGKTKEKCKYNVPPSTCKRGPAECWNDHSSITEDLEEYKCTVCDDKFTSIPQRRRHRKKST